jgi:hypothetical protein
MYSTCIFCQTHLGANESVEQFPVGRRLAFDSARGRLWVVCRRCERWNLTPLDERWEAIEECERLFRSTRLRVSTDNIGLARVGDGLELVRIGSPLRPEMAAWRYGDQFGRRRRKHLIWSGAGLAAMTGFLILGPATGIIASGAWGLWNLGTFANAAYQFRRLRARISLPDQPFAVNVRRKQLAESVVIPESGGWSLRVPYEIPIGEPVKLSSGGGTIRASRFNTIERTALLRGDDALRVAASLLPAINEAGANRAEVSEAVRLITDAGDPSTLFSRLSAPRRRRGVASNADEIPLIIVPKEMRLALEMATHEDSERRALEGELSHLETAWRQAEEIAGIADDLFVPDETRAKLSALKDEQSG